MVPRAGERIGPYEILGRLGSGGMGLVFSAWDGRLQRDVAIKLLRDEYCTPEMRSRFLQEARAASGLNHPNICTIFDIGEQKGDPYLVMELLKGETLRTRIAEGRLSLDDIVRVGTEVADALTVAHAKGIIHRDIKPANIILVEKPGGGFGTKVLDFGLAKVDVGGGAGGANAKEAGMDLTSIGSTVGTVSYMSPEQARGELLDARSDLFSLGVVMYEMATGQVPFTGATSALVFVQLLSHPPEAVRQLNGEIPRELERVINKLLEKDRSRRFQSAAALVEALRRVPTSATAGKSPWWSFGSLGRPRTGSPGVRPVEESIVGKRVMLESEPPPPPPRQPPVGESVLRPVKRIVSSDSSLRPAAVSVKSASSGLVAQGSGDAEITDPLPAGARSSALAQQMASSAGLRVPSVTATSSSAEAPVAGVLPGVSGSGSGSTPAEQAAGGSSGGQAAASSSSGGIRAAALRPSSDSVRIPRPLPEMRWHYSLALKEEDEQQEPEGGFGWVWGAVLAGAVVVVLAWYFWPRHHVAVSNVPRTLVLAGFTNSTGDNILPGVILAGLKLDLAQSRLLNLE
ncbi:MAG: serine/threonine-protein kinase, partial [Acidobacteriota bacterium]